LKAYEQNSNIKRDSPAAAANDSVDMDGLLIHRSLLAH